MHEIDGRVLSYGAGALFALGWMVFIDACAMHSSAKLLPSIELAHTLPGFMATAALLMTCVTPFRHLDSDDTMARASSVSCARLWVFSSFILSFASIIVATTITEAMKYGVESRFSYAGIDGGGSGGEDAHQWVGISTVVQTIIIFGASMFWMTSRLQAMDA